MEIFTPYTHEKLDFRKQFVRIAKMHAGMPRCLLHDKCLILNLLNSVSFFNISQSVDSGAAKRIKVTVADITSLQNDRNTTFDDVIWMVICKLSFSEFFWLSLASLNSLNNQ